MYQFIVHRVKCAFTLNCSHIYVGIKKKKIYIYANFSGGKEKTVERNRSLQTAGYHSLWVSIANCCHCYQPLPGNTIYLAHSSNNVYHSNGNDIHILPSLCLPFPALGTALYPAPGARFPAFGTALYSSPGARFPALASTFILVSFAFCVWLFFLLTHTCFPLNTTRRSCTNFNFLINHLAFFFYSERLLTTLCRKI